ncbi:hypothetical protein Pelo_17206 [Pelomyxa schiedti]|nr:hypothetical protein Pelo_17206 [Pelomyxa schiedti]
MFPLVALASRAVLLLHSMCHCRSRYRPAIEAAAGALSPRCVAWLIGNKSSRDRDALPLSLTSSASSNADETDTVTTEMEMDRRRRRKAKEQVAVLRGLCVSGHLKIAQRFVENGCEFWCEEGGETDDSSAAGLKKALVLWPPSSDGGGYSVTGRSSSSVLKNWSAPLCGEFWSKRGVFHIMGEVSENGHLDVLKWLVLHCVKEINKGNKDVLCGCLRESALNGHLHILKWLVSTFDLDELVSRMGLECSFQPRKNRVSDVKLFVETFPHWDFSESQWLASSAASCKGCSADEIIETCQWLKDRFSLDGSQFLLVTRSLPKNAQVVQWALSDVTDSETLEGTWCPTCAGTGDVEFGKWVVEEKGVAPTTNNFMAACSGTHDNVEFLKWLFQKVGGDLCPDDLVGALHSALAVRNDSIARWLEQQITTTTGSRPNVSLSKLALLRGRPIREDWLEWVLTHSCFCDIDCSPSEVFSVVKAAVKGDYAVKTKVSRAVSVWKRFPLSPVEHHGVLVTLLKKVVEVGSFYEFKQVLSFGDFTVDDLMQCFDYNLPRSTKITKWFVSSVCQPHAEQESHDNNGLLVPTFLWMLGHNKRGCAEWLFHKLKFTLPDVISEQEKRVRLMAQVDIETWKLILKLFPNITRDVAIKHFMHTIASTPLHAQFTIDNTNLGITLDDIKDFCNANRDTELSQTRKTMVLVQMKNRSVVVVGSPTAHELHPPPTDNPAGILVLSRIVWEQVVVPWVLPRALARRKEGSRERERDWLPRPAMVSCVLATAEAMFPLVALASRAVLLLHSMCHCSSRRYAAIEAAAGALSPRRRVAHQKQVDPRC